MSERFYLALLRTGQMTKTKKGDPQMALVFDVTDEARDGNWIPLPRPMERTVYLSFTDAASPYSERKLEQLGFNWNFEVPEFSVVRENKAVELKSVVESYNGKNREKFDLADWGDREFEPCDADRLRQLNARFAQKRQKTAVPPGKPAAVPPAPAMTAPPVAAAPPPPAAPPVEDPNDAVTAKLNAWAKCREGWANKPDEERNAAWQKSITEVAGKRHENELLVADWNRVGELAQLPF